MAYICNSACVLPLKAALEVAAPVVAVQQRLPPHQQLVRRPEQQPGHQQRLRAGQAAHHQVEQVTDHQGRQMQPQPRCQGEEGSHAQQAARPDDQQQQQDQRAPAREPRRIDRIGHALPRAQVNSAGKHPPIDRKPASRQLRRNSCRMWGRTPAGKLKVHSQCGGGGDVEANAQPAGGIHPLGCV